MLDYALSHSDELKQLLARFNASEDGMYFSPWPYISESKIEDCTWDKLQLVAIHAGKIQGFLAASIYRHSEIISQLAVAKFCQGHELEFASDMAKVFRFLREHFRQIRWSAIAGSPTEGLYRRIAKDQGGREVGLFKDDARLRDGRLANGIWFEVPGTPTPDCVTMIPPWFKD